MKQSRASQANQDAAIETLTPDTILVAGEVISIQWPNWLFIPGTVVFTGSVRDGSSVTVDHGVVDGEQMLKPYSLNANIKFTRISPAPVLEQQPQMLHAYPLAASAASANVAEHEPQPAPQSPSSKLKKH